MSSLIIRKIYLLLLSNNNKFVELEFGNKVSLNYQSRETILLFYLIAFNILSLSFPYILLEIQKF